MASALRKDLDPIRPAPHRDLGLQFLVFITAFSVYRVVYVNVHGCWWVPCLILTIITFALMVMGLTSLPASRKPRAKLGGFAEYHQDHATMLNLMVGDYAGGEIFTADFRHHPIESRSYAKIFWDAGESVMLFFYDLAETLDPLLKSDKLTKYTNVYDELAQFQQVHAKLEASGYPYVTLHLEGMAADWGRRFIAWLEHSPAVCRYQIAGLHNIGGPMKRRGLRRFALALLSIYWGNAAAQWLWTHGGYAVLMPISRIEKKICKDDGRESVTELIHFRRKFLSVSGLLSRLNARSRSRAWKVLEDPPPKYPVYYSVLASDRTTNPKRGWWILRAVYGKPVGRYQIPGKRRNVGGHGMLAEHWRVWQESARCFLSYRTRNHI